MRVLRLYSKPGCHLCELLAEQLAPILDNQVQVEHIDISQDPALMRSYGLRIPILAADEIELSGYPLDVAKVRAFLTQS